MKTLLRLALLPLLVTALCAAPGPDFHDHLGMQLWSLRSRSKENMKAALDLAQITGVREVETAGFGNLSAEEFTAELKARGLKPVSAHVPYKDMKKDFAAAIRDAKAIGAQYLICPSLPRPPEGTLLTVEQIREAAKEFNAWGEQCKAAGLRFGYHPHGFEFAPIAGTQDVVFDVLMRETSPELVCYELDVYWAFVAGQDPVKLMKKYPDRWRLMHLKDFAKGAKIDPMNPMKAAQGKQTAVGQGQLDWPAILRTAQNIGIQHYFIEDETVTPFDCIPQSLQYLRCFQL